MGRLSDFLRALTAEVEEALTEIVRVRSDAGCLRQMPVHGKLPNVNARYADMKPLKQERLIAFHICNPSKAGD
jgi:hypothetical protein